MMTALVFGHHPFPSPTATAQLDGIRSDLTTIFYQISPGFSSFCFWFFRQFPGTNLASSGHKIRSCWLCRSLSLSRWCNAMGLFFLTNGFFFFFFSFFFSPELGKVRTFVLGIELWNSLFELDLFSFKYLGIFLKPLYWLRSIHFGRV